MSDDTAKPRYAVSKISLDNPLSQQQLQDVLNSMARLAPKARIISVIPVDLSSRNFGDLDRLNYLVITDTSDPL